MAYKGDACKQIGLKTVYEVAGERAKDERVRVVDLAAKVLQKVVAVYRGL